MNRIDTLLLLALPASGKSEIRRYLAHVDPEVAARDFHLGPTIQLDDYPYVQLMRVIDAELTRRGGNAVFWDPASGRFREPFEWGTLTALLAEDYERLGRSIDAPDEPTKHMLDRIDRARASVGVAPATDTIPPHLRDRVFESLDTQMGSFLADLDEELSRYDDTSTVVVEFARGGPAGAGFPLPAPHGYAYTLPLLGEVMLSRAVILYVWVTPEDSRARNRARAGPGPVEEASVLHHRVPDGVMTADYGTDDLPELIERGGGAVEVERDGKTHVLAAGVFDNRPDFTTFLRHDPTEWTPGEIADVHAQLKDAFGRLVEREFEPARARPSHPARRPPGP